MEACKKPATSCQINVLGITVDSLRKEETEMKNTKINILPELNVFLITLFTTLNVCAQDVPAKAAVDNDLTTAFENVAAKVGPAVVSISTEQTERLGGRRQYYMSPYDQNDPLNRFFEDFFGQLPEREYKQRGLGSGVIIDPDGYILTNEHVVGNADKITVTIPDGRSFPAELKGTDFRSDLAVIKINAKNLPYAALGDSNKARIGQWVVAIGNPFGYALRSPEPTVTVGVISALHRSLPVSDRDKDYSDLIQTDAAINPGNSGGPLVDLNGQIIGINVAIFSLSGGYQGIGFAIPANTAQRIVERLIAGKKVLYGWLGVTVQNLDEELQTYFKAATGKGVLVSNVLSDSPAQRGGLKEGDIITAISGKRVDNVRELLKTVGSLEVGNKVALNVVREGKNINLEVEIGERPDNLDKVPAASMKKADIKSWRGIVISEITPEYAKQFGLSEKRGLVIVDVEPSSPADDAGLAPGDVIISINRLSVNTADEYERITSQASGSALLQTNRGYVILRKE